MAIGRDTAITWLGHAGVEIRTPGGLTILIDAFFENPKSPRAAADQPACDVLLPTHGHADHFNPSAVGVARRHGAAIPCNHEISLHLAGEAGAGAEVIGMNIGGTVDVRGIKVTMVPAVHSSGAFGTDGQIQYFGQPAGFVLELENGFRVYHAGDTDVFSDMALIRSRFAPDLAMLPIGGHYTMDPAGAALAAELLGVRDVLPIHWGTFPILAGTPAALETAIGTRGGNAVVHHWKPGDTVR
jgi:L-ascorbate metabolism protein UlaG (beta-lactamase superfamily)